MSKPRLLFSIVVLVASLGLGCARPAPPQASPASPGSPPSSDAALAAQAEQAVLYALPLVIMDITREQYFADPLAVEATPNRFLHIPILGNPSFRAVVRPNVDTLYSTAWLDLDAEPVLMTMPASQGRYFLLQCMDAWTNVFAAPGIRTLGDRAARYAIVGPSWHGDLPADVEVLRAPTRMVWVLGRVYVRDPGDLPAARVFQRQLDLRPLSHADDTSYRPANPHPRGPNVTRRIMRDLLHDLGPQAFFERFARLTADNPPSPPDPQFAIAVLKPLGLAQGASMTWTALPEAHRRALSDALERMLRAFDDPDVRRKNNVVTQTGWSSMGSHIAQGSYGTSYAARAAVAAVGLGANLRADAVYMNASVDSSQQPLDGSKRYRLSFAAGNAPPARAFWSITLYDEKGYLIANPFERYALKSGDPLAKGRDGSLELYLQPDDPGPDHHANWLPTPAGQRFELSLRAYWPDEQLLEARWTPPAVTPSP